MRTLYLVRHGETAWNAEGRYQGQVDVPLNERGRTQAAWLRQRLATRAVLVDPAQTAVLSSHLRRAHESARIAFAADGREILVEPDLRELGYGIFEGLRRDEIKDKHPAEWAEFSCNQSYIVAGSESRAAGRVRALTVLKRWLATLPHKHLVVVTHGGILRQLLLHTFQDAELPTHIGFSNMCVHIVRVEDTGDWTYAGSI